MYFTTHLFAGATVGEAVAVATGRPWLVFLAGLGTHAALDMVPHHDYHQARYAVVDVAVGLALGTLVLRLHPAAAAGWWGGLGGVLPDLEVVLEHGFLLAGLPWRRSCFPSHTGLLPHPHWRLPQGLLVQAALVALGFYLLAR